MHVLQNALPRVGWFDPQILLVTIVPGLRGIGDLQVPRHQFLLQLKAYQDVQIVGHFIGFNSDQRWLDQVSIAKQIVG